ncbi:MAG: RNA polymerase sigma factor [Gemmatimonadetes bacterium]|nr:RNA polymerase sigma factor [Gemmatimonadota bacterium]MBI3504484.1 RNA polymerase sigma factor [Pseudomonadota bacterium]
MTRTAVAAVPGTGDDERSLVARAAAGDRGAARALYDAHAARVHRLAFRLCGDADLAADLTQDVFVQVFRQLKTFRGESSFSTWLHRVAVTTSLNSMRKVRRLRQREAELDDARDVIDGTATADPDLRAALARAIDALPEGLRVALVMHAIEGYTHMEIGEALGIAEGTSKKRVFDARAILREALANHWEAR